MKYKNFLLRAVNLLLILGVLWQYQQVALIRAAAVSQRKQEIAEVEAYNALRVKPALAPAPSRTSTGGIPPCASVYGCRCWVKRCSSSCWAAG